ncbi:MAG: N-acetylmuramoyl-L-alanine amidase [Methylococcales bacterium]|nr:N-acetylmuramoyl-L-alanine amidase [Methylococcales bacterium]
MRFKLFLLLCLISFHSMAEKKFSVAIDIGHSKARVGAMSARGVGEFYFNRDIAQKLLIKLKNKFKHSFIINPKGGKISLSRRAKIAKEKKADILISIHHDSVQEEYLSFWKYQEKKHYYSDIYSGYSLFVTTNKVTKDKNFLLASHIGEMLRKNNFLYSRHHSEKIKGENRKIINKTAGIYEFNDLIILKKSLLPTVLVECGIIVNRKDEMNLSEEHYQNKLVNAIYQGIENYALKLKID